MGACHNVINSFFVEGVGGGVGGLYASLFKLGGGRESTKSASPEATIFT